MVINYSDPKIMEYIWIFEILLRLKKNIICIFKGTPIPNFCMVKKVYHVLMYY